MYLVMTYLVMGQARTKGIYIDYALMFWTLAGGAIKLSPQNADISWVWG